MAYSIWDYTSRANPNLLSERMFRQQWRQNKFAQWIAPEFIKRKGGTEEVGTLGQDTPKFTGAPIEVFQEFIKMGRTNLDIPVRVRLKALPVHGDTPLKGTAERATVTYRSVLINRTRKAYAPPTGMSLQIMKKYADNLVGAADEYLRQWWNDYHPGNFLLSMLAGGSRDLVAAVAAGGRSQAYVSHPNLIVAGSGKVDYSGGRPGTSGYEAAVEAALAGLTDTASDWFSVNLVKNAVVEAARARIPRIVLRNGFEYYPIWCSDSDWVQLQSDPEFKDFYKRLPEGLATHPMATGAEAFMSGAAIYPDMNMWAARINATDGDVPAGTVEYGPAPTAAQRGSGYKVGDWISNLDTANLRCSVLVGQSCLSVGVGEKMQFTEQIDDHGNVKEIGIDTIQSVVRNDIYDRDGQVPGLSPNDFHENTSSMVIATYAKHTLTYS